MSEFQKTREVVMYASKYIFGKTLDVGAGSAKYKEIITEHSKEYITFDKVSGEKIDVVGDVLKMPFSDETFDTVISTQVLEHIEKPWVMVSEIRRILKKGGVCILTAPFIQPYHPDPKDFFRYTEQGLQSLFQNEKFEIIECSCYSQVFSVCAEFLQFYLVNPYSNKKKGKIKEKFFLMVQKMAKFFDRFFKSDRVYSNSYIIARKK